MVQLMNIRQAFFATLTETEKELIWEHISNRYSWREIVNSTEKQQDQFIADAWKQIRK